MILISSAVSPVPDEVTVLVDDVVYGSTVTASGYAGSDFPDNLTYESTSEHWTPDTLPATCQFALAAAAPASLLGLAGHNLFTKSAAARLLVPNGSSRTNVHLRSEDFSTGWTVSNPTRSDLTAASAKAPDGKITAGLFKATTTDSAQRFVQAFSNITLSASTAYTASIYIKAAGHTKVNVYLSVSGATSSIAAVAGVDLIAGTVLAFTGTATIQALPGGWFRVVIHGTTSGSTTYKLSVGLVDSVTSLTHTGTGVVGAGVLVWGAHIEQTSLDLGYIRSTGSVGTSSNKSATDFFAPEDDSTMMMLFPEVTSNTFILEVTGAAAPSISVARIGDVLYIPTGVSPSYVPLHLGRQIDTETGRSRNGAFFGSRVLRRGLRSSLSLTPIHRALVEEDLHDFILDYDEGQPFFLCPSPETFPLDSVYCWRAENSGAMEPVFSEPGEFMDLQLDLEAVA